MKHQLTSRWTDVALALLIISVVSVPTRLRAAENTITSARDLYAAAEYEQALGILESLKSDDHTADDRRTIDQYRAYCLIALGRSQDAEQAIGAVVAGAPLYTPSGTDVSPRVRSAFTDVRRRLLPGIVQAKYAAAKTEFDQQHFAAARDGFREITAVLADPDMAAVGADPRFADLRMLAEGFLALSLKATAPEPLVAHAPAITTPTLVAGLKIYGSDDLNVMPPTASRQSLPPFPSDLPVGQPGILELIIDEAGKVETAKVHVSLGARYDKMLVDAARGWEYTAATLQGVPVKYRKMIQVAVKR